MSEFRVNDLVRFKTGLKYGKYNFAPDSPMNIFKVVAVRFSLPLVELHGIGTDVAVDSLEPVPIKVGYFVRAISDLETKTFQVIRKNEECIDLANSNGHTYYQHHEKYYRSVDDPPANLRPQYFNIPSFSSEGEPKKETKTEERSLEKVLSELQKANYELRELKLRHRMLKIEARDIFRVSIKKEG
jgi:hypothetical protein